MILDSYKLEPELCDVVCKINIINGFGFAHALIFKTSTQTIVSMYPYQKRLLYTCLHAFLLGDGRGRGRRVTPIDMMRSCGFIDFTMIKMAQGEFEPESMTSDLFELRIINNLFHCTKSKDRDQRPLSLKSNHFCDT